MAQRILPVIKQVIEILSRLATKITHLLFTVYYRDLFQYVVGVSIEVSSAKSNLTTFTRKGNVDLLMSMKRTIEWKKQSFQIANRVSHKESLDKYNLKNQNYHQRYWLTLDHKTNLEQAVLDWINSWHFYEKTRAESTQSLTWVSESIACLRQVKTDASISGT